MNKFLIISFIIFLSTGILSGLNLFFQMKIGEELRVKFSNLKNHDQTASEFDQLETDWKASELDREQLLNLVLFNDKDTIKFLSELDQLAENIGVAVNTKDLSVSEIKNSEFNDLLVNFTIRGVDTAVEEAIKAVELMSYKLGVDRLTVTRSDSTTEAVMNIRLSIRK